MADRYALFVGCRKGNIDKVRTIVKDRIKGLGNPRMCLTKWNGWDNAWEIKATMTCSWRTIDWIAAAIFYNNYPSRVKYANSKKIQIRPR